MAFVDETDFLEHLEKRVKSRLSAQYFLSLSSTKDLGFITLCHTNKRILLKLLKEDFNL